MTKKEDFSKLKKVELRNRLNWYRNEYEKIFKLNKELQDDLEKCTIENWNARIEIFKLKHENGILK